MLLGLGSVLDKKERKKKKTPALSPPHTEGYLYIYIYISHTNFFVQSYEFVWQDDDDYARSTNMVFFFCSNLRKTRIIHMLENCPAWFSVQFTLYENKNKNSRFIGTPQ